MCRNDYVYVLQRIFWLLFLAFYGNLDSKTGFDTDTATSANVTVTTIAERTDYVKLSNQNGSDAYMICDFTQWEELAKKGTKRDHCKFLFFFHFLMSKSEKWLIYQIFWLIYHFFSDIQGILLRSLDFLKKNMLKKTC